MASILILGLAIATILLIALAVFYYFKSSGNFEKDVVNFVQTKIIPSFHQQRLTGDQFAVLLVTSSTASVKWTKFKPSNWWPWGQPFTDSSHSTYPPRAQISNYVVARPEDGNHAERLLLDNLNTVLTMGNPPPLVIFYTWTMPCAGCTMAILRALGNRKNIVLVYTTDKKEINDGENARNRSKLAESGIQVIQAKYDQGLPPLDNDLQSG